MTDKPNPDAVIQQMQERLWQQLAAMGQASPGETCPHCAGLGVLSLELDVRHPAFGRAFKCICKRDDVVLGKWKGAGVPERRKRCSLEWFDALPPKLKAGKERARHYAEQMATGKPLIDEHGQERNSLVFIGEPGVGKSSLMACIAMGRIAAGQTVLWVDFGEWIDAILESYQDGSEIKTADVTNPVRNAPLLCLDDFGDMQQRGEVSDHTRRQTYNVLRHRYENDLPTVITTNLDYGLISKQFGQRIADRVYEMSVWVPVGGTNLRFER